MKRFAAGLMAVFIFVAGAFGNQKVSLGVQAGYFYPWGRDFRDIYGGGVQLGAELSVCFGGRIMVWAGGSYFGKTGRLSFTREDVAVRLIPLHLALGYQFSPGKSWRPFIGVGTSLNAFQEVAPLETVKQTRLGLWSQAGILFRLTKCLAFEAKCVYNSVRMEFPEADVDLSGISGVLCIKFQLRK